MSDIIEVKVPDIGDAGEVDIVEVLVSPGDPIAEEDSLVTLESDKASMEIPSPHAGTVQELKVAAGDKATEGTVLLTLQVQATGGASKTPAQDTTAAPEAPSALAVNLGVETIEVTRPAVESTSEPESEADLHAEVLVLGSGPGGYTAAFRAADLGKKVVLVERYATLGGVCLNVGCIPSKALLHAAKVVEEAESFADHGIAFGKPKIDLDKVREWKDGVVHRLVSGLATMAGQRKVEVVQGTGRFLSPHRVEVQTAAGDKKVVAFDSAIIAAGSRVTQLPFIPMDDPRVVDSTGALELAGVPKRMLVIGGGIIGLEMATVYHALGAKVTVVELMDSLIPACDKDLVRPLQRRIQERYEDIYLKTKVTKVEAQKKGVKVFFDGPKAPESDTFDRILVAVGRRPNGHLIHAEAAGVAVDDAGFIPVDRQMRTNVAHIFAIGDIVGQPMLAHKAVHEGKVAAEVAAGEKSVFDARVIPSVAYTDPEVAWVGLTETEAKAGKIPYEKGMFPWAANGRSLALGRDEGRTKLLFDPETHRVLGAGIVGPNAGDLIAEVTLAIEMDCEAGDIGLTVHPHPTLSETVAMAAEAFEGTLTDLYLPKKKGKR